MAMPLWKVDNSNFFVDSAWVKDAGKISDARLVYVKRYDHLNRELIPNSIVIDSEEFGSYDGLFYNSKTCWEIFNKYGLRKEDTVVFYSQYTRVACRIAFIAYWLGFDHIKILNGGISSWIMCGYETTQTSTYLKPANNDINTPPKNSKYLISRASDLLDETEKNPKVKIASVRNWDEYTGETMGHSWNKAPGEIKGALYAGYHNLVDKTDKLVAPSHFLNEWQKSGIEKTDEVVFYCGTGWRASLAFFASKELGWENIKLYDGSWHDWYQAHLENPIDYPIQIGTQE